VGRPLAKECKGAQVDDSGCIENRIESAPEVILELDDQKFVGSQTSEAFLVDTDLTRTG
jgi:hypothetical protein